MKATSERDGGSVGRRDIAHSSFSSVGRGREKGRDGPSTPHHTTPRRLFAHLSLSQVSLCFCGESVSSRTAKRNQGREKRERKGDKRGLEGCEALGRARYKVRGGKRNGAD